MKVKKFASAIFIAAIISIATPAISIAAKPVKVISSITPDKADPALQSLLNRIKEIQLMNKENLSRSEKKNLRKELKGIKKEIRRRGRGIYLSLGAVIVIVVVLILIL